MAGAVREDGHVLMIHRQKEPYKGLWAVPGGKLEIGEHPDQAVLREFREETGLEAEIERYCGCASEVLAENSHFLLYVFRLKVTGGTLTESHEGPLRWLDPATLDGLAIPSDLWMIRQMLLPQNGPALVTLRALETSVIIEQQHP